jgi:hypothetical protein
MLLLRAFAPYRSKPLVSEHPTILNPRVVDRSRKQFIVLMSHLGLSYPNKMNEAVPANEYCGNFISKINLESNLSLAMDIDHEKVEQTLSTNTETYEDYFAMCI